VENSSKIRDLFQLYFAGRIESVAMLAIPLKTELERGHLARMIDGVCKDGTWQRAAFAEASA
jgi:hypothetical protein